MIASRLATKMSYHLTLKMLVKVTINKIRCLCYYMTDFHQTFIELMLMWPATKILSADLENVDQGHCSQISLYLGYYATNFSSASLKCCNWG